MNLKKKTLDAQFKELEKQEYEHYDLLLHRTKYLNKLENTLQSYKQEIKGHKQQLEDKDVIIKNLQQCDCSCKELKSERKEFEVNKNLVNELETQYKALKENNVTLRLDCDKFQNELSKVSEDLKFSLQKQAGLEEYLCIKEK